MDDKHEQPVPVRQPAPTQTYGATIPTQPDKPKLALTDLEAQSILAINGVDTRQRTKLSPHTGMVITIIVLIILIIVANFMLKGLKSDSTAVQTNHASSPGTTTTTTGNGVDKQVNQDVNSCSNIVNAVSEC